jgi:Fic family protein
MVSLPVRDKTDGPFRFARSDGVLRLLHQIDRDFGGRLEVTDPQLANAETRDRYLIQSLMEEAITSSQLEGASTTRKVAREMLLTGRRPRSRDERMILNNFRAMELIRTRLKEPLSVELILELHEVLTEETLEAGEPGRFRRPDEQVTVQAAGDGQVLHVPPPADELPTRIGELCRFANEESADAFVHPVVRAIVLHFGLAYDHPFVDGNGRTARALFYWSLLRQGYWLAEFLSISSIIKKAPGQYSRAFLYAETDGSDLTYFLLHQLEVTRSATQALHEYLTRKAREVRETERLMRDADRFNHRQRALLAHALRHPTARYTIEAYRREHGVVYQTARQDLLSLADAGYLKKTKVGPRFCFDVSLGLDRMLSGTKPK